MNAVKQAVKDTGSAIVDTIGAAGTLAAVTAGVAATLAGQLPKAVTATPDIAGALLTSPFDAGEGYLIQEGVEASEAHERAYKLLDQPVHVSIRAGSVGAGKLLSEMLQDEAAPEVDNVDTSNGIH